MAEFDPLKPEPDPGPYDVMVDGETVERIYPNNTDTTIVLQTTTTTEINRINASVDFNSEEYVGGKSYNVKSFGSAEQLWHKELQNIEASVSAHQRGYDVAYCNMTLEFENRDSVTIQAEDRRHDSSEDHKTATIDSGILTGVSVSGDHRYSRHAVEYTNSSAYLQADVPVNETVADITSAQTR
jgi:hypothetical protein